MADALAERMANARTLVAEHAEAVRRRPASARSAVGSGRDLAVPEPPPTPQRRPSLAEWATNRSSRNIVRSRPHLMPAPPPEPTAAKEVQKPKEPPAPATARSAGESPLRGKLLLRHVRSAQADAARLRTQLLASPRVPAPPPPPKPPPPELYHSLRVDRAWVLDGPTAAQREQLAAERAHARKVQAMAPYVERHVRMGRSSLHHQQEVRGIAPKRDQPRIISDAAAAAASARLIDVAKARDTIRNSRGLVRRDTNQHLAWAQLDGARLLEPSLSPHTALGDSPVRLVDSRFLISLAKRRCALPIRQQIPESAFVPLEVLKGIYASAASAAPLGCAAPVAPALNVSAAACTPRCAIAPPCPKKRTHPHRLALPPFLSVSPTYHLPYLPCLPSFAFAPPPVLPPAKDASGRRSLRICFVSRAWLQPDHPDPQCGQLALLGKTLEALNQQGEEPRCAFAVFLE